MLVNGEFVRRQESNRKIMQRITHAKVRCDYEKGTNDSKKEAVR